jgi:hypothetical protein
MDYDKMMTSGVYTVYDNQVLSETLVVSEHADNPIHKVYQWSITNSPKARRRVFDYVTNKWSAWQDFNPPT